MARAVFKLDATTTYNSIDLTFQAVAVAISNPTASPVYVRVGAPDTPTAINADLILPAAMSETFPVSGRTFGIALGNVAIIASGATALSGLLSAATLTFLSEGEQLPSYGNYSFQSLSISDLSGGLVAFVNGTTQTYDINAWGGAIVTVIPTAGTGQGGMIVSISSDGITFRTVGQYSFWPSVPATLLLSRPVRWLRIQFANAGIAGEPAIGGFFAARGSLSEINQVTYNPVAIPITFPYNIPTLGSAAKILATAGVNSISIAVANNTGNDNGELLIETSQSAAGPWQIVAFREQLIGPAGGAGATIFRTFGNLGFFTRVTLLSTGIAAALAGSIYFSITVEPDLNGILQQIYSALGDVGNTVNVDQSIYHLLAHMKASISNIEIFTSYDQALANIEIYTNTSQSKLTSMQTLENANLPSLPAINTLLGTIDARDNSYYPYFPYLSNLSAIAADIAAMHTLQTANLPSILNLYNLSNGYLPYLTNLTNLPTISSDIALMRSRSNTSVSSGVISGVLAAAAGFNRIGLNTLTPYANQYIVSIQATLLSATNNTIQLMTGTVVAASGPIYTASSGPGPTPPVGPEINYASARSGGYLIPASQTDLWANFGVAGTLYYNIAIAP